MRSQVEKRKPKTPARAKKPRSGDRSLDVAKFAALPDTKFEAAVHKHLDALTSYSRNEPLEALAATLDLMQGLNAELLKAIAPAVVSRTQDAAAEAQTTGTPIVITREHVRAMQSLARIQESTIKIGVARVKVHDEQARRWNDGNFSGENGEAEAPVMAERTVGRT